MQKLLNQADLNVVNLWFHVSQYDLFFFFKASRSFLKAEEYPWIEKSGDKNPFFRKIHVRHTIHSLLYKARVTRD